MTSGWQCPGCGRCYAPIVQECGRCAAVAKPMIPFPSSPTVQACPGCKKPGCDGSTTWCRLIRGGPTYTLDARGPDASDAIGKATFGGWYE